GLMLAGLYVLYVLLMAKLKPHTMPPLPEESRRVTLTGALQAVNERVGQRALPSLVRALKGRHAVGVPAHAIAGQLFVALLPLLFAAAMFGLIYRGVTAPIEVQDFSGLQEMGLGAGSDSSEGGL